MRNLHPVKFSVFFSMLTILLVSGSFSLPTVAQSGETLVVTPLPNAIRFATTLPQASKIQVQLFDLQGAKLYDSAPQTLRQVEWDRTAQGGQRVAYGVYLYVVTIWDKQDQQLSRKLGKLLISPNRVVAVENLPVDLPTVGTLATQTSPEGKDTDPISPQVVTHADDVRITGSGSITELFLRSFDNTREWSLNVANGGNFFIYDEKASSTRWSMDTSGNVGLGTSSPTNDLHIRRTDIASIKVETTGSTFAGIDMVNANRGWTLGVSAISDRFFISESGTRFFIDEAGQVGINRGTSTTTLQATLDVGGDIKADNTLGIDQTVATVSPQIQMVAAAANLKHYPNVRFFNGGTAVAQLISDVKFGRFLFDYCAACGGDFTIRKVLDSGNANDFVMFGNSAGNIAFGGNTVQPGAKVTVNGNFHVNGNISKTGAGELVYLQDEANQKQYVYSTPIGPEVGTYVRGTAQLVNGEAVIELPEHFAVATSEEDLTVQMTPIGQWLQLYIVEKGVGKLVIREADGKDGQFDYLVQGIRKGYEGYPIVQP